MNVEQKSAGQKNVEFIFEKLRLIHKLKFRVFNSMVVILIIFHSTCYPIFGSLRIFNSTFFKNSKTILLLNLLIYVQNEKKSFKKFFNVFINVSGMKERERDMTLLVNQIVLFFLPFCFTIELLASQASNFKLCRSGRYCSCLTHFGSIFPLMPTENTKNMWFSDDFKRYKKVTLT